MPPKELSMERNYNLQHIINAAKENDCEAEISFELDGCKVKIVVTPN